MNRDRTIDLEPTTPVVASGESTDEADESRSDAVAAVDDATQAVAQKAFENVHERPWFRRLTQVGWVAKGIVYASLGWAAIEIALAKPAPEDVEYTGIVSALARGSVTRFLLALIAVGLVLYIIFRLLSIALITDLGADGWVHRVAYLVSAGTYTTVAAAAGFAAVRGPQPEERSSVERVTRSLLDSSWGRIALVIAGVVALGVAVYFLIKGVTRRFMSEIDKHDMSTGERRIIEITGAIGWIGRGVLVGIVALFVTWSAIDADPADARGLDSSMHRVANERYGAVLVLTIGCLLLIYAAHSVISARRQRLAWHDNPEPAADATPTSTARSTS